MILYSEIAVSDMSVSYIVLVYIVLTWEKKVVGNKPNCLIIPEIFHIIV